MIERAHETTRKGGLTRRGFLKTTSAVVGVASLAMAPALTALGESGVSEDSCEETMKGRCLFGGCFNCERDFTVRDGYVVNTAPSDTEITGKRPCQRAYNEILMPYYPNRLKYPMKRVEGTERGAGEWERITWDEAIDTIVEKINHYQKKYGTRSVMSCMSSGLNGFSSGYGFYRLMNGLATSEAELSADNASNMGFRRVWGSLPERPCHVQFEEDVYNSRHIILWSSNPSEANIQRHRHYLMAQRQGAKIHVIDPHETNIASRAYRWYPLRPGTDAPLILSCCQVILEEGLEDREFIEKESAGAYLVKKDGGYLHMSDLGVEPVEGPADPQTGQPTVIDPYVVWDDASGDAAAASSAESPAFEGEFTVGGLEVETSFSALKKHLQEYAPEKVAEIVDLPVESIRELAHACADTPVSHCDGYGWQAYDNGVNTGWALGILMALTGDFVEPGANLMTMAHTPPTNYAYLMPGFNASENISVLHLHDVMESGTYNGEEYPLKMLVIGGQSILGGGADYNRMLRTVMGFEYIVTFGITYNDNAMYSDLVLPCAMHPERQEVPISPLDSIIAYSPKLMEPRFEARNPFDIWKEIGTRLGQDWDVDFDGFVDKALLSHPTIAARGITMDRLRKETSVRWRDKGWILEMEGSSWGSPTGKLQFYDDSYTPRLQGLPIPERTNYMPVHEPPREAWETSEVYEKYPLTCISNRARFRWHTDGWDSPWLNELEPEQVMHMNKADAEARGLEDGSLVEAYNDRGRVVVRMYYDAAIRPGTIMYPKGLGGLIYKTDSETVEKRLGNFSELTSSYCNPWHYNTSFFDAGIEVRAWNGEE